MTDDELVGRVRAIVDQVAGPSRIPDEAGPDTPLGEAGFWLDSLDLVEVVLAAEREFQVGFEGETDLTPASLASIRSFAALIRGKLPR